MQRYGLVQSSVEEDDLQGVARGLRVGVFGLAYFSSRHSAHYRSDAGHQVGMCGPGKVTENGSIGEPAQVNAVWVHRQLLLEVHD